MNRRTTLGLLALAPFARSARAQAVDPAARDAALAFLRGLDSGDMGRLYREHMTPQFQAMTQEQFFVGQVGIGRVQAGGPAQARTVIGGQPFQQLPTGQQGQYYYVRFQTQYPSLPRIFQDVYLERVGGAWKVGGFQMLPAPGP